MSELPRILLLDSAYPVNVRNRKVIQTLVPEAQIKFCAWNRDGRPVKPADSNEFIYDRISHYGARVRKMLNLVGFAWFIRRKIRKFRPQTIIASHWDMLLIAAIFKPRKCRLVYENLDMPTASSDMLRKVLVFFERQALRKTEAIIFASRFFEPEYSFFQGKKVVAENKPYQTEFAASHSGSAKVNSRLVITFLGTVRYFEIMKRLIDAVKDLPVQLEIWGDGPDEQSLKQYGENVHNVKFHGRYEYSQISTIYNQSDVIWAVYPSRDHNVKYAISNKYHECMLFHTPGIFASNTKLGDMVVSEGTGFTADPYSTEHIRELFMRMDADRSIILKCKEQLERNRENRFWEDYSRLIKEVVLPSQ